MSESESLDELNFLADWNQEDGDISAVVRLSSLAQSDFPCHLSISCVSWGQSNIMGRKNNSDICNVSSEVSALFFKSTRKFSHFRRSPKNIKKRKSKQITLWMFCSASLSECLSMHWKHPGDCGHCPLFVNKTKKVEQIKKPRMLLNAC